METINVSLIIPCYNEGSKLFNNITKIIDFMKLNTNIDYEILIVNDGSKDNTYEISKLLSEKHKEVKSVGYLQNRGKGGAVKEGILQSKGEWIIFMDADLSTNLVAINEVLNDNDNYDVIIGSRRHDDTNVIKGQNYVRKFTSKTCSILTNLIIPLHINDTQCGFKAFKGNIAYEFALKQQLNGFAFDVELLYMAKINKCKIKEFGVEWENDEDSRVSVVNNSINFFIDLLKIRKNKKLYKI